MRPITEAGEVVRYLALPHAAELPDLAADIARSRVLLEGHFELQSGRHSRFFVRFAGLGWNHDVIERLVPVLVKAADIDPDRDLTVLAPESAGLLLGRAVADYLGAELAVAAVDEHRRPLPSLRHGKLSPSGRILVVNDVITTGASLEPLLTFPHSKLIGLLSFAALSTDPTRRIETQHGVRPQWLVGGTWNTYERSSCPLCANAAERPIPAGEFN